MRGVSYFSYNLDTGWDSDFQHRLCLGWDLDFHGLLIKVIWNLSLIGDNQPRATITPIYTKLGREPQLSARRATEGIHVSLFFVVPKVIFDQHLHADLSFGHSVIISESGLNEAK